MNNLLGFTILDRFRHTFDRPPNRPAVTMQGMTIDTTEAISFRLYQGSTRVTLDVTDNEKDIILDGLGQVSFLWAATQAGTSFSPGRPPLYRRLPGIETPAIASVPVVERFTS